MSCMSLNFFFKGITQKLSLQQVINNNYVLRFIVFNKLLKSYALIKLHRNSIDTIKFYNIFIIHLFLIVVDVSLIFCYLIWLKDARALVN